MEKELLVSANQRTVGVLLLLTICVTMFSCRQLDVFEKSTAIPDYKWQSSFAASGEFNIIDTVSAYNLYIVLRHTDAYPYNNIWLNVGLQSPGDTMFLQRVDLSLGNDANGWEGRGMNDIWEVRKKLNAEPRRFRKKGAYKFDIYQIMRDNPLPEVMSAGLRIEKAN
ncbi:MAG: gldH [Ferruginibacter sp.]|nr:gldH [Ferruginibacter sp.]